MKGVLIVKLAAKNKAIEAIVFSPPLNYPSASKINVLRGGVGL